MAPFLPEHNSSYKDQQYWNKRYEQEEEFDWFKKWEDLKGVLSGCIHQDDRILMLGW
jgi:EEF1A lysine methyltransferase 4